MCRGRVLLGKREGAVHPNTIATAIHGVAINKLLLSQRHNVACAKSPRP